MSPQFNAKTVTTKARSFVNGFTPGQRAIVIVSVLGLLLGTYAVSKFISRPSWAPLYGGLSGEDASAITDQLNTDGVQYKLSDGGTSILVPQASVASERIKLAGAGLTGSANGSSSEGWSLLDKQGITATDFQQNVAYQRALSGELSTTLEAMDGVDNAVVQLAIPQPSVFSDDDSNPTASVLLKIAPGTELNDSQVQSVTHLVAGSVPDLKPDNVTVSDQNGNLLSGAGGAGGAGAAGNASSTDQQTAAFEGRMNSAVQDVLNAVVGPGNSVVRVNAQLNFDNTTTTSKNYSQPTPTAAPLSEASVNEQYSGNGAAAGGALGTTLPTPLTSASGNGNYSRIQTTVNNAVSESVSKVEQAPGQVQRMTVAVVLNSKTAGQLNTTAASQLVTQALGLNPQRGDAVQVSVLPFSTTAAAAAQKALADQQKAQKNAGYVDLAKKVGLALLILIVLIVFWRRRRQQQAYEEEQARIEATASDLPGMVLPQQSIAGNQQLALAQEADLSRDRMRDEVSAMVDNQPDDVAAMLQGWLAERK